MFEPDVFIGECQRAGSAGPEAILEVVARAVSDPRQVLKGLGEPTRAGLHTLFRSADLFCGNLLPHRPPAGRNA